LVKRLAADQVNQITELAKAGIPISKIAQSLGVGKTTVYYHCHEFCHKMTTLDLRLLDDQEKGYIIGFFLGDGSFNTGRKTPRYIVRFALDAKRDQDIAARLRQILLKAHKKVSIFARENTLIVKVCSKDLVKYIKTYVDYKAVGSNQREKMLMTEKNWSREFQYGILSGIIDSDGHVHRHLGTEIKTVSTSIFKGILDLLNNLEIAAETKQKEATSDGYSRKPFYIVYFPSLQMKKHKGKMHSVKIERLLQVSS